ncbi:MAG: hypothetical protein LBQ24_05245 [Candidatus Peribacteria bacterium]|jgi:hypothetical protein|nr:hypothetical protein [Candidatus Peribacteria bacterium]
MFKELYASYEECLRRKANTKNAIEFTIDKERKLLELVDTLKNRKYIP